MPGDEVAIYEVIGNHPVLPGATNDIFAVFPPGTAVTPVGTPGTVVPEGIGVGEGVGVGVGFTGAIVILFELTESPQDHFAFIARTLKVYVVPAVNPEMVIGDFVPEVVIFPGSHVITYEVMGVPHEIVGGINETVAAFNHAVATTLVGTPGIVIIGVGD